MREKKSKKQSRGQKKQVCKKVKKGSKSKTARNQKEGGTQNTNRVNKPTDQRQVKQYGLLLFFGIYVIRGRGRQAKGKKGWQEKERKKGEQTAGKENALVSTKTSGKKALLGG